MNGRQGFVRIMTWNIHGAVGPDRRRDLARVVDLVRSHAPDIVALQEVDSRPQGAAKAEPAFEFLAQALGEHAAEARLITAPDGDYGHVVLSRWPLSGTIRHDISLGRREPRAAIETSIDTGLGRLHVVAAHLGLRFGERRHQAALLAAMARAAPYPSVVIGDFNDWVAHGSVQRALARWMPDRTRHKTFPARLPCLALDRIYAKPEGVIVRSWTDPRARRASDHLPVIADLDLGSSASPQPGAAALSSA
jgi:endonuclease/exonuclease/phosphatase family metal-dependent hydrolase